MEGGTNETQVSSANPGSPSKEPLFLRVHRLRRWHRPPQPALERILKEGRNCWRIERAERLSYVVDACDYFKAFYEAALRAEKRIVIVGWDTDSRVELLVGEDRPGGRTIRLKKFLFDLCEARPELEVFILSWDFNLFYAMEREKLSQVKFDWLGHERVRFVLDSTAPALGSHHQKIVVIDDRIAFSGGLDITARRWDTPEHFSVDERRTDPWGKTYDPFHDVQVAVEGPAARALGDLVRERWRNATGEDLPPIDLETEDAASDASAFSGWPPSLDVDVRDVPVGISRTIPGSRGRKPVSEVERLFLDSIAKAKRFIFFEAQYFSSRTIARALSRRLREPDGPEVVMVIPRDATGWIEESTMTVLRARMVEALRQADRFGRFKVYHPVIPGLTKGYLKIHSKVTVIDDDLLRIGSANLNQRSLGLDTECDLTFESGGDESLRRSIASLRSRLLGEHLGVDAEEFEARFQINGSLLETIESFRGMPRTLVELERRIPEWLDILVPESEVIDPSGPYRLKGGLRRYFPSVFHAVSSRVPWLGRFHIVTLAIIVFGLLMIWEFTPLRSWARPEAIATSLSHVKSHPMAPLLVVIIFVVGGLVMVPLTGMVIATVLTFGGLAAFGLSLVGTVASSCATYWLGSRFRPEKVQRLANRWLKRVKNKVAGGGWMAVAAIRTVPVAPFTVVNLVAGSIRVPFRDFVLGTVIGTLPGLTVLTLLADRVEATFVTPSFESVFLLAVLVLAVVAAIKTVRYFMIDRTT